MDWHETCTKGLLHTTLYQRDLFHFPTPTTQKRERGSVQHRLYSPENWDVRIRYEIHSTLQTSLEAFRPTEKPCGKRACATSCLVQASLYEGINVCNFYCKINFIFRPVFSYIFLKIQPSRITFWCAICVFIST